MEKSWNFIGVWCCLITERESRTLRINDIHELVHQLPEPNFELLEYLIAHLHRFVLVVCYLSRILFTRQTLSTNYTEHIRLPYFAPLNAHLYRIKKEHPVKCVYCPDSDETVERFLFHCPLYDNIRTRLLPAQLNIHNTLYGSTTQLQRTATYNMSAMNRRDKIVRSLGDQER